MSALNMAMNGNAYKMIEIKKVSVIYILYDNTFLSFPKHGVKELIWEGLIIKQDWCRSHSLP